MIYLFTEIDPSNSWYTHHFYDNGNIYRSYKMNNSFVTKSKIYHYAKYINNEIQFIYETVEDAKKHIIVDEKDAVFSDIRYIKEHIERVIFDKL